MNDIEHDKNSKADERAIEDLASKVETDFEKESKVLSSI